MLIANGAGFLYWDIGWSLRFEIVQGGWVGIQHVENSIIFTLHPVQSFLKSILDIKQTSGLGMWWDPYRKSRFDFVNKLHLPGNVLKHHK
ncbi:hypothetical protein ONS95_015058 [Cadophora gregata]|uniref:uncharacterized protein n=1 Tax=Cadophora gregata TaxID=51156 RepID=UPI0026DAEC43|nr:uncharacterized protein ONS95_015058 [Cadophora gregata]KAK0122431.1 hypothetical protein ONS95_015058 [Cadophora gregata]